MGKTCLLENILFILPLIVVVVVVVTELLPPAAATAAAAVAAMIELLVGERSSDDDDDGSVDAAAAAVGADTTSAGVVSPLVVGAILIGALRFIASDVDVGVDVVVVVVVVLVGATFSSFAVESRTERRLTIGMPPLDETSLLSLPVDDSGIVSRCLSRLVTGLL